VEDQSWKQTYPGRRECVSALRTDVRAFLVKNGCPDPVIDAVEHGMSELGANAVIHTASGWAGDGAFVARVFSYAGDHRGPYVWAEVENDGFSSLDLKDAPPLHGLDLVRRMVTRLGTERGERGRVVWFTVAYKPDTGEINQSFSRRPPDAAAMLALNVTWT
jgi:anti-sigma regulatory factor (Ser/Thr protein kinase)